MSSEMIRVRYTKSSIGYEERQKATVRALGLRRLGDEVIHADSPAIRGMVRAVAHLVSVEPVDDPDVRAGAPAGARREGT